jgi:hypothetical protein
MKDTSRQPPLCNTASRSEGDVIAALLAIGDKLGEIAAIIASAVESRDAPASVMAAADQLGSATGSLRRLVDEFLERIRPA